MVPKNIIQTEENLYKVCTKSSFVHQNLLLLQKFSRIPVRYGVYSWIYIPSNNIIKF